MAIEPKPFQQATIYAAIRAFKKKNKARRFLVADEVGLGKTIVARGIIESLAIERDRPLRVFYICSNLSIAKQNLSKLVSFLPGEERNGAIATVDRPSLMPTHEPPDHNLVQVFSLTPDTALPTRRRGRREGRAEERALGLALLNEFIPSSSVPGLFRALRMNVKPKRFRFLVKHYKTRISDGEICGRGFLSTFRRAIRIELGLRPGQHLPNRIRALVRSNARDLVATVRSALAVAALDGVRPDLVIFDEFQRFRDLLKESTDAEEGINTSESIDGTESRVLHAIRGDAIEHKPALLLLSATPYSPYTRKRVGDTYADAAADFFNLVGFLFGGGKAGRKAQERAKALFATLGEEFRKDEPLSDQAQSARADLSNLLTQVVSRTERPRGVGNSTSNHESADIRESALLKEDIASFRHLHECLQPNDQRWIVPLWQSVPLPMQSLGGNYKAWRNASTEVPSSKIAFTSKLRRSLKYNKPWPNPRLRAFLDTLPLQKLALPWVAPSLRWWPLRGGWKQNEHDQTVDGKLLVFSRFRAVPSAVSGLVSFALEAHLLRRKIAQRNRTYEDVMRESHFAPGRDRMALFELFHPSPIFAQLDPLIDRKEATYLAAKASVEKQLRSLLAKYGIRVANRKHSNIHHPWELLTLLEKRVGCWKASKQAWKQAEELRHDSSKDSKDGALQIMIEQWDKVQERGSLRQIDYKREFLPLVDLALEAPGAVLGRALARHWPHAFDSKNFANVVGLCWWGLRLYFDSPWFVASFATKNRTQHPKAVRGMVVDGNLESVLDEHFWHLAMCGGSDWNRFLVELEGSFRLRTSSVVLHESGPESDSMRLRCHAAVPLSEARRNTQASNASDADSSIDRTDSPWRPEEVRRAFNAPFWPHVLTTTSIGQEGLDFHPWCNSLAHWDLCAGPVALQQREGRVSRFAGLGVRRAIVRKLAVDTHLIDQERGSPWKQLASTAEDQLADESGLAPWWILSGAEHKTFIFEAPGSEQRQRLAHLHRELALYRLVLGMPDQADLLELLASRERWSRETIERACLDLSAFRYKDENS